jgi:hypothetical protein
MGRPGASAFMNARFRSRRSPTMPGSRRPAVTALPGRCTLMEHLWLPGIALPAREPSMRRRRPGGLGRERRLHGIWRTADAARQLRWGAQNGAGVAPELGGGVGRGRCCARRPSRWAGPARPRTDAVGGRRVGGGERHAEAVGVHRHIRLAAAAIHPDPSTPASTTNPLDSPVTPPPTIRTGYGSLPARVLLVGCWHQRRPGRPG